MTTLSIRATLAATFILFAVISTAPEAQAREPARAWLTASGGGGAVLAPTWGGALGVFPVTRLGVGLLVEGGGPGRRRAIRPLLATSLHGTAGYVAFGGDVSMGLGLSVRSGRHRWLLHGGPLVQWATLYGGASGHGVGGYLETALLRRVLPRVEAGVTFRVVGAAPIPQTSSYATVTPSIGVLLLLR